jgi:hypothetical protein
VVLVGSAASGEETERIGPRLSQSRRTSSSRVGSFGFDASVGIALVTDLGPFISTSNLPDEPALDVEDLKARGWACP